MERDDLLTLTGTETKDETRRSCQLALETEYDLRSWLALAGRWEIGSFGKSYPVTAITYYPLNQHLFRLSAETVQQPGRRSTVLAAMVQF